MRPILLLVLLLSISCSHKKVILNYKHMSVTDKSSFGNSQEDLGEVSGEYSGFAWESCEDVTKNAAEKMLSDARNKGANGVTELVWKKKDYYVKEPTCKKAYGWFGLYILGGLGPWVSSAKVKGRAVKTDETSQSTPTKNTKGSLLLR